MMEFGKCETLEERASLDSAAGVFPEAYPYDEWEIENQSGIGANKLSRQSRVISGNA